MFLLFNDKKIQPKLVFFFNFLILPYEKTLPNNHEMYTREGPQIIPYFLWRSIDSHAKSNMQIKFHKLYYEIISTENI